MKRSVSGGFTSRILYALFIIFAAIVLNILPFATAKADTVPDSSLPATVSADVLPTVQVDGVVWATATYGSTVYATGRFSYARPAGTALGDPSSVVRSSLLAFDINTGELDTNFVHSLGGSSKLSPCYGTAATGPQGCAIEVSPNGTRLYVGGLFSTVDGQTHKNFAAIDLTSNTVLPGFSGTDKRVNAIAASDTQVYIGGTFSKAGGATRGHLASYNLNGSLATGWKATVHGSIVRALTIASGHLVVGGLFTKINSTKYYSLGAVSLTTGKSILPWASHSKSFPIRDQDPYGGGGTGITSLSTDGSQVYLTSFTYIPGKKHPGTFEGRAAISAVDGKLIWMNDCVGDSYDAFPIGQVLYSASHSHACQAVGAFPDTTPRGHHHAMAETTYATGKNNYAYGGTYPSFIGKPAGTVLDWFPTFSTGTVTGISQAGWTVTGNPDYVVYGGEFPAVNGVAQQGLVRFAIKSLAPNKIKPVGYGSTSATAATVANSNGESVVSVQTTYDPDNEALTYALYRSDSASPIATQVIKSTFWNKPVWTFVDTGRTPGETASYRIRVTDPFGNYTYPAFTTYTASPIDMRYASDAAFAKDLGAPITSEVIDATYRYRDFANGRAYWTAESGIHYVTGKIKTQFIKGGAHATYGEPTTDPAKDFNNYKGTYVDFSGNSTIYYTSKYGAHDITGPLRTKWIAMGRSASVCGYPKSNKYTAADKNGTYIKMSGDNCYIYYSATTGAWSVRGKIGAKWLSLKSVTSKLGYPISDQYTTPYGSRSDFQGGYIMWNSAKKKTYVVYN